MVNRDLLAWLKMAVLEYTCAIANGGNLLARGRVSVLFAIETGCTLWRLVDLAGGCVEASRSFRVGEDATSH